LARKAASIGKSESLGSWLYGVAYRTAAKARARAATRQRHEKAAGARGASDPLAEVTGRELLGVLDEELQRLAERDRAARVLRHLEGRTRDEAAQLLGLSQSTLQRRLEQARGRLRDRLARRGLTLCAALGVTGIAEGTATASLPARLVTRTVQASVR